MRRYRNPADRDEHERVRNRRSAMDLARRQARSGCHVCGAFFSFMHEIGGTQDGSFENDFYDVDFEDDSDEMRPY